MHKNKKTAVVTGAAGFIGSHMVDLLLSKNFNVIGIDNLVGGHEKNLKHHTDNKNFNLEVCDINKLQNKNSLFSNTDYVFHFAGIGDIVPSIEKPYEYFNTNVLGTISILNILKNYSIKKFVYAASSSCYGLAKTPTNENHPIDPKYPYALSKYQGEQCCLHWQNIYNLPVVSIRIFNAYGPRVRTTGAYGAVFGVFLKQKLENKKLTVVGDGEQRRDFLYVTDVANAFYLAATSKYKDRIYNVGAGKPKSINALANMIGGDIEYIPKRPGEPDITWANINKISKELNWKPQVKFADGVKKMLNNIDMWKDAPLWNKANIKQATKT